MTKVGTVAALYRFPVKSMLGERLDHAEMTVRGVVGDRAFAVVDREDGRIATGKHPRKWARLVKLAAAYVEGAGSPVEITFPDGSTVRSGESGVDTALSGYLGRDVALISEATEGQVLEEVWPAIDGLAPPEIIESMSGGRREAGQPVSDIPLSSWAPAGTFFDLTTLHVLTTATLRRLAELEPEVNFDVRRYRPNVLVEAPGADFVENGWERGMTLHLGSTVEARVDLPTMRCVMTTLARDDLTADRASLRAVARHNRVQIGDGAWACAGVCASVTTVGDLAVGETVVLS